MSPTREGCPSESGDDPRRVLPLGAIYAIESAGSPIGGAGFSFWANDLGGYFSTPSPELYIRWTQFAFFCSHVRVHGGTPREPWLFGDEALVEQLKRFNRTQDYSVLEALLADGDDLWALHEHLYGVQRGLYVYIVEGVDGAGGDPEADGRGVVRDAGGEGLSEFRASGAFTPSRRLLVRPGH